MTMVEVDSGLSTKGNPYLELEACFTKAEEEINLTLRALSSNNVRATSSSKIASEENNTEAFRRHNRQPDYYRRGHTSRLIRGDHVLTRDTADRRREFSVKAGDDREQESSPSSYEEDGSSPCSTSDRRTSLEKSGVYGHLLERKQRQLSKNARRGNFAWKHHSSAPRLIHSMHSLNSPSSAFEDNSATQFSSSSSASSACSTLSTGGGEQLVDKRRPGIRKNMYGRSSESAFLPANPSGASAFSSTSRFQSARNLRQEQQLSLCSTTSAYELLDLTNSDSVSRWTSQILAELDTIADCPPEIVDGEIEERSRTKRDSFYVPAEAKRKLEEACTELRELKISGASVGGALLRIAGHTNTADTASIAVAVDDEAAELDEDCKTPTVSVSLTWPSELSKSPSSPQQLQQAHYQAAMESVSESTGSQASTTAAVTKSKRSPEVSGSSAANRLYCSTKEVDLQSAPSGDSIRATTNICQFPAATRDSQAARGRHFTSAEMNNGADGMIQAYVGGRSQRGCVGCVLEPTDRAQRHSPGTRNSGDIGANDNVDKRSRSADAMTNYISDRWRTKTGAVGVNNLSAYDNFDLGKQQQEHKNSRHSTVAAQREAPIAQTQYDSNRRQYPLYRSSTSPISGKSVRGVVDSLIRQAETHLGAVASGGYANTVSIANNNCIHDVERVSWRTSDSEWKDSMENMEKTSSWLRSSRSGDYVELHDACTQTTPVSLSRSSSFTWVSEFDQRPTTYGRNCQSYGAEEVSPTDMSGGSGLDDEDIRSLTPMTDRPDSNTNATVGVDHGSALDKSLSLSGISHSSSSSADFHEYIEQKNPKSGQKVENLPKSKAESRGTVMGISGVNSAIQRRSSGKSDGAKVQKVDSSETWPPTNNDYASASGEPLLTQSFRSLLETVSGSAAPEASNKQGGPSNTRKEDKFNKPPVGIHSLASGRGLTRSLIASSSVQQQQSRGAAAFPRPHAADTIQQKETGGGGRIVASSIPSQQHVHVAYDSRKRQSSLRQPTGTDFDFEESIYDNVPRSAVSAVGSGCCVGYGLSPSKCGKRNMDALGSPLLRRDRRSLGATPDSPYECSLATSSEKTVNAKMQRDLSVASGLLADSESSPICAERGFALLDGFRSDMATPDSVRSLTSSDGGNSITCSSQPAPEFQYKSARDYIMDREAQIRAVPCSRSAHRCPTTTMATETTTMGFVPKESVLRGETTRFLSPPSPNTATTTSTTTVGGESSSSGHAATVESGSKLSLVIPFETRSALANSLPALDRLLDSHSANLSSGSKAATAPVAVGAMASVNGSKLVADSETAESSGAVFSSRKENAEAEARQCCFWLKAAGFPQYASMYEDGQFPIDIEAAQKDHEFLDCDSLQALFRRLHILNQCALMKLGAGPYEKRVMQSTGKNDKESDDDEDEIALSRKWRFVRKSRTWSRIVNDFGSVSGQYLLTPTDSSLSPPQTVSSATPGPSHLVDDNDSDSMENSLSVGVKQPTAGTSGSVFLEQQTSSAELIPPPVFVKLRNTSLRQPEVDAKVGLDSQKAQAQQRLRRSQSERLRDKAKALVRRMELMKNGRLRRRSPSLRRNGAEPEISGPVLIQHFSASPAHMRMLKDSPVTSATVSASDPPTSLSSARPISDVQQQQPMENRSDGGDRRHGRVFAGALNSAADESKHNGTDSRTEVIDYRSAENVVQHSVITGHLDADCRSRLSNGRPLFGNGQQVAAAHRQSYQQHLPSYDQDGKRHHADSDSSPETQAKSGSSLRVQVDVDIRTNTLPPVSQSSFDSSDADHSPQCWERRDSGVGSSLSRSPSAPGRPRVRWHSFQRRHGPSAAAIRSADTPTSVDHLTAPQMIAVQKYALLKLTALMEKYSPSYKSSGWSWGVQKLLRRMKASESKADKDRHVFGVPFSVIAQRTGQPLPQCILHAMRYLRKQAVDSVGLFRKSGVRSRIQKLRQICETSTDLPLFESQQAYDVADMVKQYFRELPEPLLTSKLSETFIAIHLNVPEHMRMEAMQKLVLLLPDENREVLLSLLFFLHDIASHSNKNQMSAQNLAVCFAPTLFQLSGRNSAISPTRRHKTITTAAGLPNEKELMENRAAQICLASMIVNCKTLFSVPQDILMKCAHTVAELHDPSNLAELGYPYGNYSTYLAGCVDALMKEHRERWRGWVTEGCIDGVEVTSKKTNDEYPLKLWRCWVDVEAPPRELLHRILRERDAWDDDIIKWRVVRKLSDNCDVFQFVVNDMPPHPTRDYCVVRLWQSDIHELRGGCVLVQTSVNVQEAPMLGGVRGVCLASRYLIEPSGGGKSRITHVDRVDTRGRSKAWYNKVFGYLIATQLARLRDSFKQTAEGPETKV